MASDRLFQLHNFLGFEVSGARKSCHLNYLHLYRYRTSEYSVKNASPDFRNILSANRGNLSNWER
jgi:hypothetical protein